jgi:hypothetical protein
MYRRVLHDALRQGYATGLPAMIRIRLALSLAGLGVVTVRAVRRAIRAIA